MPHRNALVPRHLGDNRRRRNRSAASVTANQRLLRLSNVEPKRIDKNEIGGNVKRAERFLHRPARRFKDIDAVDAIGIHSGDSPSQRPLANASSQDPPSLRLDNLAVRQTSDRPRWIENHRCGEHRTEETPPTNLVDSRDEPVASRSRLTLESAGDGSLPVRTA